MSSEENIPEQYAQRYLRIEESVCVSHVGLATVQSVVATWWEMEIDVRGTEMKQS